MTSEKNLNSYGWKYDRKLKREMSISDYQDELYRIDPNFRKMQALKDKYIRFNDRYAGNPAKAKSALKEPIALYRASGFKEFIEMADSLEEYFVPILNSFILVEKINNRTGEVYDARFSNGPVESVNRIIKDMKRPASRYNTGILIISATVTSLRCVKMPLFWLYLKSLRRLYQIRAPLKGEGF